jgi:beta-glucuronidase
VRLKVEGALSEIGRVEARGFIVREGGVDRYPLKMYRANDSIVELRGVVDKPDLWHFDFPNLYRVSASLYSNGRLTHDRGSSFGIREIEVKKGFFYLNGEPMRLMGVEWMPGSDPRYGMAEPEAVMHRTLQDMKELNAVLTRFHWQQDPFVFEFCDRNGILVQEEVPAWGRRTMKGSFDDIQLLQMKEMITAHYNHPSIYAWGICNEIGGQSPEAHKFVARGVEIARSLDPSRLTTWASNSLQKTPEKDASSLVDFIEWNDYWESWYGGSLADLEANLQRIAQAFPEKALVISEYGLCECNPKNPVGDSRRIEILKTHTDRYREAKNVAGAIFFDYNDYRTHIGDKGQGAFRQRVHGVVDLLGKRKPSWQVLRAESSPIRQIQFQPPEVSGDTTRITATIHTRSLTNDLPAYTLRKYLIVWTAYNQLGHPLATGKAVLPKLTPGSVHEQRIEWKSFSDLSRVQLEIFRPNGFSVLDADWTN